MCGIIGYIGKDEVTPFLVEGLKKVEYRGYDSSGIAVLRGKIKCIKAVGKLDKLREKVNKEKISGMIGIGHSRWATHGEVTEKNAHPHWDCQKKIFIVHNGIIENYKELRSKLQKRNHRFVSETDTEVLAHLIEHFFINNLEIAVKKALRLIKGTYGIAVISENDPEKIVVARMFSPLVVSINDKGAFISSDPAALISYSKKMIFLEDGDVAVIKKDEFLITNLENEIQNRKEIELDWDLESAQKKGYAHFMLKEIMEQPESVMNSLRGRLVLERGTAKLGGLDSVKEKLEKTKKINIIACGTSYYAGVAGKYLIEELSGISVDVDLASEFRYRKKIIEENEVFIFISQSGETADSLAALREVKERKALTLGIVNVVGSSIARETDAGIYNHAGPEIGVASTKAFTSQIAVLVLLAVFLGRQRNLSFKEGEKIIKELSRLPELLEKILKKKSEIKNLAEKHRNFKNFFFMGRKYGYPVSLEGALKLKEISYLHAEGYAAGEMKHGPIALVDENVLTVAVCLSDGVYDKMVSNIEEIKARKGPLIVLATEGNREAKELTKDVIYVPKSSEFLSLILSVVPFQIFAYYMAVSLGNDPDKPRNLAKSVTVE